MPSCKLSSTVTLPPGALPDGTLDVRKYYPDSTSVGPSKPPDAVTTGWFASMCDPEARYRLLDSGKIEIDGVGVPSDDNWPGAVEKWKDLIVAAADEFVVPSALIAAVMAIESGGIPSATSSAGALGLMQLMRGTAKEQAGRDVTTAEIVEPSFNIRMGTKLLASSLEQYKYNFIHVLASYNVGHLACRTDKGCEEDNWNLQAGCGYIDKAFASYNTAIDRGFTGAREIDLGDLVGVKEVGSSSSFIASVGVGLLLGTVGGVGWWLIKGAKP